MFGKKKEVVEYDGLPVLLSKREAFDRFTGRITSRFLAYRVGDEWKGLVGYEQFREELDLVNKKLELILSEINLTYQPETEKREPARLVVTGRITSIWDILERNIPEGFDAKAPVVKNGKVPKKQDRPKKK